MNITPISDIISKEKVDTVSHLINNSEQILITTHFSPDGDALGSSLALYHYLIGRKKNVKLIVPNSFPYFLKWLKGASDVLVYEYNPDAGQKIIENADLIFCLDFNTLKRIGDMSPFIEKAKGKKVLVDHHPNPSKTTDVTISYPKISSTSEIIFRLLFQMNEYDQISKDSAEAIYCGMMTDTGGFTFNSSNPEIFEIISLLLRKGINKDEIYAHVYSNFNEDRFRLLGFVLSERMKIYNDAHSALIYLSKEDQNQFRNIKGDTEGFVNYPLSIKNIVFSTFIREDENLIKLSFRSQGNFPCNEFASEFFNGGGHFNASGGEFYGTMKEALAVFEKGLEQYLPKLKSAII